MTDPIRQNSRNLDVQFQKQVKEIADRLQKEIKQLDDAQGKSSANELFYPQLIKEIEGVKENASNPDAASLLGEAIEKLKKAATGAKNGSNYKDTRNLLIEAHADLLKIKNVRA